MTLYSPITDAGRKALAPGILRARHAEVKLLLPTALLVFDQMKWLDILTQDAGRQGSSRAWGSLVAARFGHMTPCGYPGYDLRASLAPETVRPASLHDWIHRITEHGFTLKSCISPLWILDESRFELLLHTRLEWLSQTGSKRMVKVLTPDLPCQEEAK